MPGPPGVDQRDLRAAAAERQRGPAAEGAGADNDNPHVSSWSLVVSRSSEAGKPEAGSPYGITLSYTAVFITFDPGAVSRFNVIVMLVPDGAMTRLATP